MARTVTLASATRLSDLVGRVCDKLPDEPEASPKLIEQQQAQERYRQLAELLRPMGKLHENCTLENYEIEHPGQGEVVAALRGYATNMRDEVAAGNGVILFGPSGNGKDHLLTGLARLAILEHGLHVMWTNGMDLYGELRDRIRNDQSEAAWVAKMAWPDLLYISDPLPPRDGLSPFQSAMLQRILDQRTRMMRPI